jgi:hypothetical protein
MYVKERFILEENTSIETYNPKSVVKTFEIELEELLNKYCFINETTLPNKILAKHIFEYILLSVKLIDYENNKN